MRIRRILQVGVVVAGVVVLLLVLAAAFLHTPTAKHLALEQIQKFLARQDIAIEAADFGYSIRPLRISTGRVSIRKLSRPDLPPLISADHFTAGIRFYDLFHDRYRIEDLQLDHPVIRIVVDEGHRDNIPGTSNSAAKTTPPIDLLILKLRATGGALTFEDRSKNLLVQFPQWDLSLDGVESTRTHEIQFRTNHAGEVRSGGKILAINSIAIQASLKSQNAALDLHGAQVSSDLGEMALHGNIANLRDPLLDLSVVGDVHLVPVREFLSVSQNIQGDLHIEASLKGRPEALQITGHLAGRNLSANEFSGIALDTDLTLDPGKSRAQLTSFRAQSPNMAASGAANIAFTASAGESEAEARIDIGDLKTLFDVLKFPAPLSSRVTGIARVHWPGMDFGHLNGNGRIQLFELPPVTGKNIPVAGVVKLEARGDDLTAAIDSLDSGALHVSGQVNLQALKRLNGALRIDVSDTAQALPQVAGWFGSSLPANLRFSGPAIIDANLSGTVQQPLVGAIVAADDLHLNDLKNIHLNAAAEISREQMDVQRVLVQWETESMTGTGRIGWTQPEPTIEGQIAVANASIQRVLSAVGRTDIPADGSVEIAATVSGTLQNAAVHATLSASGLQAYGEPFGTLSAVANLHNQVVLLDSLSLHKTGGGELQASGQYNIASGSFHLDMNGKELQVNRFVLPQGPAIHGDFNLTAAGDGTLENPAGLIQLSARELHVDATDVGSADLNADVADHRARITATAPYYGIAANGTIGVVSPFRADVELHVDSDIASFPVEQLKEFSGRVTANLKAAGNLTDIQNSVVQAEVPNLKLDWRQHAITIDEPIQMGYTNRELTISQAAIRFDNSTARLSGNIPLEGSIGQLKVEGRANLADLTSLIPFKDPILAQGQLLLNGTLQGNLKRIEPDLAITITDGSFGTSAMATPLRETNLKAVARDGRVVIEQLTAKWGGASISAQGEATFALLPQLPFQIQRPDSPIRLQANVEEFKLSSLTKTPQNTDGTISIRIDAQTPRPDISAVQLKVTFPDLKLNVGAFELEQVGISSIAIRNGIASIEQFALAGPKSTIQLSGTADLRDSGPVDVKLTGDTDAAVLGLFSESARWTGATRLNVDVSGTLRQPIVNGHMELQDGQAQIDTPRIAAENVQVRLDLNGNAIDVTQLEGTLNGGAITGEGRLNIFGNQPGLTRMTLSGDGIYLEFPKGVKTVSNTELRLDGVYPNLVLSGNVDVEEGTYTDPLIFGRGLMSYLTTDQQSTFVAGETADLNDTRLNVTLKTLSPFEINNNIARGEIQGDLRLLGTIGHPGLTGRIEVEEGAILNLRERKYSVDRGVITFTNEHAIEPILDMIATTKASNYDITMKVSGNVTRKLTTDFTSSPTLDEVDIVSVLATGRTRQEATTAGGVVAREQVLSYIAGDLGSSLTSEAGRAIGLSRVQIEPNLIANEAEPTARLTIGKDITAKLNMVYSMNLRDSNDQIWIANYNLTRRFSTSALRQNDNTYRLQLQHDVLFGLPGAASNNSPRIQKKIGSIEFSHDTTRTNEELLRAARLKTGKLYDFFSVQDARQRLRNTLAADERLEARISVNKRTEGSSVDLAFKIEEGPQVQLVFEGWEPSNERKAEIRKAWSDGVIDVQRIADVVDILESDLIQKRYFGFHLDNAVVLPGEGVKRVRFKIEPGRQYGPLHIEFEGVHAISESTLQKLLKDGGYFDHGSKERDRAIPPMEALYKERGYLDAKIELPHFELDEAAGTARTVIRVMEGSLYRIGRFNFQGNAEFKSNDLSERIRIEPEAAFQLETVRKAQQTLEETYRKTGYHDVVILYRTIKDSSKKLVDVVFDIQEGLQRIVKEIQVEGNQRTSAGLVRSQLALESGDILSDEKLSQARLNLYDAGAYSFVDIEVIALDASTQLKSNQVPVRLVTRVREIQPWQLKYGGFFDTQRGPGAIVDFSNRNMLGSARVLGVQVRYDADLREGRMYFSQPVLRRLPIKSLFSAFKNREEKTDSVTGRTIVTEKKGLSPTFEYHLRKNNVLALGYRIEITHAFDVVPDPLFPEAQARTAPLTSSLTRDTRDDPFDATNGHFMSHAVDWGTAKLGSQLHYFKYFGQYFQYVRFGKPTVVPWTQNVRNRVVMTYGARVGVLKREPSQDFRTEKFTTGGGTTVRGFAQDRLGPLDSSNNPTGGDAVLILNTELRFPAYKFIDGVAFVDAGNVYSRLQDFSPFKIRASYGVGLRIRTPYLLLRLDYGINMKTKPGESKGKFFGSLGQAF